MRFAVLGVDQETLQLLEAAAAAGHQCAWCGDFAAEIEQRKLPTDDLQHHWQDLFDPQQFEAILVGQGAADTQVRSQQLQDLAKAGCTLLVVHPMGLSVLSYFEIDMARGESGANLLHYNPLTSSPVTDLLAHQAAMGDSKLGTIEQVIADRALSSRDRSTVLTHFARDVQLLAHLAGRFDRIGCHGAKAEDEAYTALSVQLSGPGELPVRWSVEPVDEKSGLQVSLIGSHGRLVAEYNDQDQPVQLYELVQGKRNDLPIPPHNPAAAATHRLEAAVQDQAAQAGDWQAALEAMELTDSIEISLRRGRTIDVHHQQLTEHLAFKGTMAAAGCGILLVLPPMLLLVGWLAGLAGVPVARYWPHLLGGTLALFLLLQLLPKLLYLSSGKSDEHDQRGGP